MLICGAYQIYKERHKTRYTSSESRIVLPYWLHHVSHLTLNLDPKNLTNRQYHVSATGEGGLSQGYPLPGLDPKKVVKKGPLHEPLEKLICLITPSWSPDSYL